MLFVSWHWERWADRMGQLGHRTATEPAIASNLNHGTLPVLPRDDPFGLSAKTEVTLTLFATVAVRLYGIR